MRIFLFLMRNKGWVFMEIGAVFCLGKTKDGILLSRSTSTADFARFRSSFDVLEISVSEGYEETDETIPG